MKKMAKKVTIYSKQSNNKRHVGCVLTYLYFGFSLRLIVVLVAYL
jgi:hypothetical protein